MVGDWWSLGLSKLCGCARLPAVSGAAVARDGHTYTWAWPLRQLHAPPAAARGREPLPAAWPLQAAPLQSQAHGMRCVGGSQCVAPGSLWLWLPQARAHPALVLCRVCEKVARPGSVQPLPHILQLRSPRLLHPPMQTQCAKPSPQRRHLHHGALTPCLSCL